jgi:16S rRNA (adenine1518-N6/adenine1519-N6)-dimethyltransferase
MPRAPYGQNFLNDTNAAKKIVESLDVSPRDYIIEIGPGRGMLTGLLLEKGCKLTAVELDRGLSEELVSRFSGYAGPGRLKIVTEDFLDYRTPRNRTFKYISNLPYYAASPIIRKVVSSGNWKRAVFTTQKEVAERIASGPGGKSYGALTLFIAYFASSEILFDISGSSFSPPPKVSSSVILLTNLRAGRKAPFAAFSKVVSAAFFRKRKTALNSLSAGLPADKRLVEKILLSNGILPSDRAEQIPLEKFISLTLDMKNIIL